MRIISPPIYPRRAEMCADSNIVISGTARADANVSTQRYASYSNCNSPYHDGDITSNGCLLAAGTYTLDILYIKQTNSGKVDVYVDTTKVISLNDCYNGTTLVNQAMQATGIVLAAGWHYIKFVVNGKNAGSGGYAFVSTAYNIYQASDL